MPKLKQKPVKPRFPITLCSGRTEFKGCGKLKPITNRSKKLCLYCNIKRLRQLSLKRQKGKANYVDQKQLNKFYKQFWDSQPVKQCFETGESLYGFRSWHVHHVIEKKPHPEHIFNPDVCVLLTLLKHRLWHDSNEEDKATLMPKTYQRLLELRIKYNIK